MAPPNFPQGYVWPNFGRAVLFRLLCCNCVHSICDLVVDKQMLTGSSSIGWPSRVLDMQLSSIQISIPNCEYHSPIRLASFNVRLLSCRTTWSLRSLPSIWIVSITWCITQHSTVTQDWPLFSSAFFAFQSGDDALLNDKKSSQYYFSTVLVVLNFLTTSPDVCIRIARHPTILNAVIEKMLSPTFEEDMKASDRSAPGGSQPNTFDSDFGTLLQFISTLLLYQSELTSLHPKIKDLIPLCKTWRVKYKKSPVRTISNASDRLVTQIEGMAPILIKQMREMQAASLCCGQLGCKNTEGLIACARCRIQRYCGQEHQKSDWKYHKKICVKGLEEAKESEGSSE